MSDQPKDTSAPLGPTAPPQAGAMTGEALEEFRRLVHLELGMRSDGTSHRLCLGFRALLAEVDRLRAEACRWYLPDGSYETLASPEEVIACRKRAAAQLELFGRRDACPAPAPSKDTPRRGPDRGPCP